MFSTEDRWERIAAGLFWTGWLFVVFTVHAIYSRDDWQGIAMTAAPAGILFAGWYLARARSEYLLTAAKPPRALAIGGWVIICAGTLALVFYWANPRVVYVAPTPEEQIMNMRLSPTAIEKMKLSARRHSEAAPQDPTATAPEGCDEWIRKPDPTHPDEMIGYCARWK